jgi:hypothetical protein
MWRDKVSNRLTLHIIPCVFLLLLSTTAPVILQGQEKQDQIEKPLQYQVAVNIRLIPIFAVNGRGEPVYDIKESDLDLYINGRLTPIQYFNAFDFETEEAATRKVPGKKAAVIKKERVVFLILDAMFNSITGFRRTKDIAVNLIKQGQSGDSFVVIQNHAISGLLYVGGPELGRQGLITRIMKLKLSLEKRSKNLFASRLLPGYVDFDTEFDARLESSQWHKIRQHKMNTEKFRYRYQMKRFKSVISQLKYALKTIKKPKVVFLISEGIARGAFKKGMMSEFSTQDMSADTGSFGSVFLQNEKTAIERNEYYSTYLLKYLTDIVKAINLGGGILYTINPQRINDTMDEEILGQMSLMFLANHAGGKYFAGSEPEEVVRKVVRTTSAYYELGFMPPSPNQPVSRVAVRSKRKGVIIHTINHIEKKVPYPQMAATQKKLFAFNAATGGNWSRMAGKVVRVKYDRIQIKNKDDGIKIQLPEKMQNKKLDIFLIQTDSKTHKTEVRAISQRVREKIKLIFKQKKGQRQYFVLVEPVQVYCIYNLVK